MTLMTWCLFLAVLAPREESSTHSSSRSCCHLRASCSDWVGLVASSGREDLLDKAAPSLRLVVSRFAEITTALMSSMTSAVARPTGWSSGEVVLRPLFGLGVAGFRGGHFANGGPKGKRVESVEAH